MILIFSVSTSACSFLFFQNISMFLTPQTFLHSTISRWYFNHWKICLMIYSTLYKIINFIQFILGSYNYCHTRYIKLHPWSCTVVLMYLFDLPIIDCCYLISCIKWFYNMVSISQMIDKFVVTFTSVFKVSIVENWYWLLYIWFKLIILVNHISKLFF